jgi:hypothetical protein
VLELADHSRRDEGRHEVDAEPWPAVQRAVPWPREQVFVASQTGPFESPEVGFTANEVHHGVDRQTTHEFSAIVDHGCRHQVVALERAGGLLHLFERSKGHCIGLDRGDDGQ